MSEPKEVGLALGGGAALGAAHIGVLRYLEEKEFKITHIAGTSVGALAGGAYACGVSLGEMTGFARRARWTKLTRLAIPRLSLFTNERLQEQLRHLVGDRHFNETAIPFAAVACSLVTGREVVIRQGPLVDAILASCAIPGIFEPVERDGDLLCDGGVANQVPDDVVWAMGAQRVVGVDLISNLTGNERPDSVLGVFYKSMNILIKRTISCHQKTIMVYPGTKNFSTFDLKNYQAYMSAGYRAAQETLEEYWPEP